MKRTWKGYLFAGPLLLGFLLFYVLPFGQVVVWDSLSQGTGKSQLFVGLENYSRMFQNDMFRMAFGNTLGFLGIGLPVILLVSYGLALFLKRQARRFQLLRTVFLLPYVMPVAGTVLLVDLLFSREGLVNRLLLTLGLPLADWLQSPAAFWVMLILYLWKSTGYAVVLLLAGLMAIPPDPGGGRRLVAGLPLHHHAANVVRPVHRLCLLPYQRLQVLPGDFPGGRGTPPPVGVHAPALYQQFL